MGRRLKIVSAVALAVIALTLISENIPDSLFVGPIDTAALICLPLLPGYIGYIIVTGDIHGWQPGPIGYGGRVAVSSFFNILFWLPIVFKLIKRKAKNVVE
ncbi:hypothetical protein [Hymenobacter sp. YC55]|uniref:hypothetical protein n=1 Tax=Hymenobacter sp. YC55 TaxID=3034019 RepID=UPI0023F98EEC|nr:hypothetical protein [Hymenobacter sp. YC55]MDF7810909.1 hypothetical protein [Hymenobacter sp. YC55]